MRKRAFREATRLVGWAVISEYAFTILTRNDGFGRQR